MSSSLEKRKKFLPCIVHANRNRETIEMFLFPDKNVLINSNRTTLSFDQTGYTTRRSTAIDCTDPRTPFYTATLELIPRKIAPAQVNDNDDVEDDNNNTTPLFTTTITIPIN